MKELLLKAYMESEKWYKEHILTDLKEFVSEEKDDSSQISFRYYYFNDQDSDL